MAMNHKKTLRCELVRTKGILDVDLSLAAFAESLSALQLAETISDEDRETITESLDRFLNDNAKPAYPISTIATVCANRYLEVPTEQVESTQEKVKAVIRSDDRFFTGNKRLGVMVVDRMSKEERAKYEAQKTADQNADAAQ